jgi:hypothetical protein
VNVYVVMRLADYDTRLHGVYSSQAEAEKAKADLGANAIYRVEVDAPARATEWTEV